MKGSKKIMKRVKRVHPYVTVSFTSAFIGWHPKTLTFTATWKSSDQNIIPKFALAVRKCTLP